MKPEKFKQQVVEWAGKIGVEPKEIHVREMSRKWASCSTRGRLTFSCITGRTQEEEGLCDSP